MKNIYLAFILISFLFSGNYSIAQYPPMNGQGMNGQRPSLKGHVYGKVVNEKNLAIDFATIVLMKPVLDSVSKSVSYAGYKTTTTESNGEFIFEDFDVMPKMKIRFTSFGYVTQDVDLVFDPKNISMGILQLDLGRIKMEPEASTELDEVKIVATKPLLKLDVDKRVFDVSQNPISEGGTAVDVMKNVPGVNVDMDGNVQVRNSAPQIYIDGRPTTLTLDQIPADAIETVEVMTNPSAKYDASGGGAGIINIVLKKNKKTGYNGSIRAGVDSYLGHNVGGDINYRQNKFNFSASLNYRARRGRTTSEVLRENYRDNDTIDNIMTQNDVNKQTGGGFFGRMGIDYLPTNKTSFSLGFDLWSGAFNNTSASDINTDSIYAGNPDLYYYQRLTDSKRNMINYGVKLGYKQLFRRAGEELTFDGSFNTGTFKNNSLYTSEYHVTDINSPLDYSAYQKIIGSGDNYNAVFQADYVLPLEVFKIETGLRAQLRGRTNLNDNYRFINDDYLLIPNPASNYSNTDNVYAAYVMLSKQYKKIGYKVGLRAESSDYKGKLAQTGEEFKVQYPVSLFPSAFLSYQLTEKQFLQLNYSRRVERPNFFQLIPFVDSVDVFNMSRGNAALKPEFTDNIELQYLNNFDKKNTLLASVYYKYTTNLITRYIEQADNGALINTYINANSSYSTGLELISTNSIKNWLEITSSVNVYNSKINSDDYQSWTSSARWSWFGKLNLAFKLPAQFTVQLTGIYQSRSNMPVSDGSRMMGPPMNQVQSTSQGYIDDFWAVDIAVRKTFFNRKLAVNLSVSDIFGSRHYTSISQSGYFYQYYDRLSNPYMVRLNVSWTFGKMDVNLFKRLSKGTGESVME
ncbi:MAG: TonB-dependent receptor [Flavobacteriia bacterium]|nr:TonB-dependent receptor [Flavobacteriia bacterium]OJX36086.1 MAG: hypothetical protein BGO87_06375 [Flavobacteriia bacterium 40-80]